MTAHPELLQYADRMSGRLFARPLPPAPAPSSPEWEARAAAFSGNPAARCAGSAPLAVDLTALLTPPPPWWHTRLCWACSQRCITCYALLQPAATRARPTATAASPTQHAQGRAHTCRAAARAKEQKRAKEAAQRRQGRLWLAGVAAAMLGYVLITGQYITLGYDEEEEELDDLDVEE